MKDLSKKSDAAPHDCTECGSPAYIPFSAPARCTGVAVSMDAGWFVACPRFDQQIYDEHVEACSETEDKLAAKLSEFVDEKTDPQINLAYQGRAWVTHLLNHLPQNSPAPGTWTYQLPKDAARQVTTGERFTDGHGRAFRVTDVDRVKDQITVGADLTVAGALGSGYAKPTPGLS